MLVPEPYGDQIVDQSQGQQLLHQRLKLVGHTAADHRHRQGEGGRRHGAQRQQGGFHGHAGGNAVIHHDQMLVAQSLVGGIAEQATPSFQFLLLGCEPALLGRRLRPLFCRIAIAPHHHPMGSDGTNRQFRPGGVCNLAHRPGGQGQIQLGSHGRSHRHPAPWQSHQDRVGFPARPGAEGVGQGQAGLMAVEPEGRMEGHGGRRGHRDDFRFWRGRAAARTSRGPARRHGARCRVPQTGGRRRAPPAGHGERAVLRLLAG